METRTHIILLVILCFIDIPKTKGGDTDLHLPVTIVCNLELSKCAISDTKLIKNDLSWSSQSRTMVIRCCPQQNTQNYDIHMLTLMELFFSSEYMHTERICQQPYQPSVIHIPNTNSYQIGYALSKDSPFQRDLSMHIPQKYQKPEGFYWFTEIRTMYDVNGLIAQRTNHKIYGYRHSKTETCPNYQLGIEQLNLPDKDYIKNLYSSKNQSKVLKELSENLSRSNSSRWFSRRSGKERQDEIVIHHLIPIDDFIEDSLKISTCSYLNTVPLLKSVAEGSVQVVENYIRKVANAFSKSPLSIWTEIYYEPNHEIYLDQGSYKLPIPSHFIKIISYSTETTNYFIAIVIHNEIRRTGNKICKEITCKEFGWDVAATDGGLAYCCELNDLISITGIDVPPANRPPFDLYHVPVLSKDKKIIEIDVVQFLNGEFPPLAIVYYPETMTYELSDLKAIRDSQSEPLFSHIILCCPAETLEQDVMISMSRLDNLLFIKGIFQSVDEISTNLTCQYAYQPSIIYGKNTEKYYGKQGYEIGYVIKNNDKLMKRNDLPDMQKFQDFSEYSWFQELWISYNFDQFYPFSSLHTITPYMHSQGSPAPASCTDMALGIEWFEGLDVATLQRIFSEENYQDTLSKFANADDTFEMHQLASIDDYALESSKITTCTFLNVVPMWKRTSNVTIRLLEQYIRKLVDGGQFDLQNGTLEITTVPYQVLKLPLKRKAYKKVEVFLHTTADGKRQFPVPRTLMKIIALKVPLTSEQNQDHQHSEYRIFAMVIVIHNELSYDVERICTNVCTQFGWTIEREIFPTEVVYCCKLDQVNLLEGFQRPYGDSFIEPFDLNNHSIKINDLN